MVFDQIVPRRALISVSDKTGLIELAEALVARGVALVSTGGTAQALRLAGLEVSDVADLTGFPEMLDGRVKTLHPAIHGGILARRDTPEHQVALETHHIFAIDLVIINLYPFATAVARDLAFDDIIENIDIGGPSLIRGAAKNHEFVTVLTDPSDYPLLLGGLDETGAISLDLRRRFAAAAFARTAAYDAAISRWFGAQVGANFPRSFAIGGTRSDEDDLRYGENPHQQAAFYRDVTDKHIGVGSAKLLQGKALSYNNINDTDAAFELVSELPQPAIAIIKHANPCGVATAGTVLEAYRAALDCDPTSAFGGIIAANVEIDVATAEAIQSLFAEVVIAPSFNAAALEIFAAKKNLRILQTGALPDKMAKGLTVRSVAGGLLVQERDTARLVASELRTVTTRAPTKSELADLHLAFAIAKHAKSNAIVLVKDGRMVGIGSGATSRVDAAIRAVAQAARRATESGEAQSRAVSAVVASDAFFPFPDGLITCLEAGVSAAIQPGGSIRDAAVIEAANQASAAMIFTNRRHFKH